AAAAVADGWDPLRPLRVAGKVGLAETAFAPLRPEMDRKRRASALAMAALLAVRHPVAAVAVLDRLKPRPPTVRKAQTIELSDSTFYLQVKLTTLGAGIQKLTLPKFQAANEYGRPLYQTRNGKDEPVPFDLIPEDPI